MSIFDRLLGEKKIEHSSSKKSLDDARTILQQCKTCEEKGDYTKIIELCDKLLANYRGAIDAFALREKRALALNKIGRYEEAKNEFKEFLLTHKKMGFPIASSTWMHNWLVAHYKGDKDIAMAEFIKLNEENAIALLNL